MIQDFDNSDQPALKTITREVLACLAWGAIYPLGIKRQEKKTPRKEAQRTVVFVHGYFANRASFFPLSAYLRSMGIKQILSFNYSAKDGIEGAAKELREFLRLRVRGGKIDLVCHSLGGVIARVYVQELGGARRVNRCISLGTPHRGTYNSYWAPTRIGRELRPDSPLMKRLATSRNKSGSVKFTSIVGETDNMILPRVFAGDCEDTFRVPDVGHMGLLFSPSVFFEVARRLKQSD